MDPNLIRLAEAYKTAFQNMLPLPPVREDVHGELEDTEGEEDPVRELDDSAAVNEEDDVLADLFGAFAAALCCLSVLFWVKTIFMKLHAQAKHSQ